MVPRWTLVNIAITIGAPFRGGGDMGKGIRYTVDSDGSKAVYDHYADELPVNDKGPHAKGVNSSDRGTKKYSLNTPNFKSGNIATPVPDYGHPTGVMVGSECSDSSSLKSVFHADRPTGMCGVTCLRALFETMKVTVSCIILGLLTS